MTFMRAFFAGIRRTNAEVRLILVLYVANLLLAVPIALGFRATVASAFGNSTASESLMRDFDYTLVIDFMNHHGNEIRPFFRELAGFALVSMLLSTFLAGGTLAVLRTRNTPFSAEEFFRGCGRYVGRFFRLFLIFGILLILLLVILNIVFAPLLGRMVNEADSEIPVIAAHAGAGLVYAVLTMLVLMAADYAKIMTMTDDATSMIKVTRDAFRFLLKNLFSAVGLQGALLALLFLCIAAYWGIEGWIGMTSPLSIAVVFLVQQIFMISRMWVRVAFFSAEIAFYDGRKPQPVRFMGWDDSPLPTPA